MRIFWKVTQLTLASFAVFYVIHLFAKPQPKTMSKEWQEASNEYAKVRVYRCYGELLSGAFLLLCG
jgi:phage-related protein